MKRNLLAAALVATALPAAAQITLYNNEEFDGRSVTVDGGQRNLRSEGFNDRASSAIVRGGRLTLPHAVTRADVGLGYTSTLVTLRPEVPLRDGTLQGRKQRWAKILARVLDAAGLTINGRPVPFRTPADPMGAGLEPRDRDVELAQFGWGTAATITLEQRQPLPCTVLALVGQLDVEES